MQLKHQKGKLLLRKAPADIIQEQCAQNGLSLLPIEAGAIYGLGQLPFHHVDPFDRLIISQAKLHGLDRGHQRWRVRQVPATCCLTGSTAGGSAC